MSLMSVIDVAKRLKVCDETVYRLCSSKKMPHSRVGRQIRVSEQQLQDYLNGVGVEQPQLPQMAQQRTQRITRCAPQPNWDSPICQPRKRSKAG